MRSHKYLLNLSTTKEPLHFLLNLKNLGNLSYLILGYYEFQKVKQREQTKNYFSNKTVFPLTDIVDEISIHRLHLCYSCLIAQNHLVSFRKGG